MPKQKASAGHTLIVSSGGANFTLTNIAFGDVFLCSGQSNMQFSTNDAFNASAEIADSINYPDLRFYTIKLTEANSPQYDGSSAANYQWGVSGPSSFVPPGGAHFSYFSATCYFFGRDLYKSLGGEVPIGLVASDWGGQRVECFSSPDALADETCGGTVTPGVGEMAGHDTPNRRRLPGNTQLWYGQIYPFLPMRFKGATWYQGEANAGDPDSYACRFPAMIADWRKKFDLPDMSFFFVQLAAFSSNYALIRQAQTVALKLPNTGMAVAIDIGDPTSPEGSIHPRRKQEVGRRLSLSALAVQYGKDVVYQGPTMVSIDYNSHGNSSATVHYDPRTTTNLHASGTAACTLCCDQLPFELQLEPDRKWVRATEMDIQANTVVVRTNVTQAKVVGVRFDFEGYPQCALYNGKGGPDDHTGIAAPPFQVAAPLPPPKSWTPVFRQTLPGLYKQGQFSLNPHTKAPFTEPMFSVLDQLEAWRHPDTHDFEFMLRWPDPTGTETLHWKQITNPFKDKGPVTGYEPVNVTHTDNGWAGLRQSSQCLMDGSSSSNLWFYCVGYRGVNWGHGLSIPSWGRPASVCELQVKDTVTGVWEVVFRQTLPHLYKAGEWRVNANDPGNETYAVLDTLERFRSPTDGKIEFKLYWPDARNIWRQTSNPTSPGGVKGYMPVSVEFTGNNWGGLEYNQGTSEGESLLDGSVNSNQWFYAVGWQGGQWGQDAIPGPNGEGVQSAELFVSK